MHDGEQNDGHETIREYVVHGELVDLKIKVSADLYRAYQRCSWIITHETGREQVDIMEEMVHDFLVKNGC